jgi:hypothetical protein
MATSFAKRGENSAPRFRILDGAKVPGQQKNSGSAALLRFDSFDASFRIYVFEQLLDAS